MPAAKPDRSRRTVDGMINKMKAKFPDLTADQQLNLIKVAILWEKTKKDLKDDEEGSFFRSGEADEEETETEDDD